MIRIIKSKIMLIMILFLFILILPNYANAAKISVGKVKGVKVTSQDTSSIKVTWSKVSKATGYRVYVYNSSKKKYEYYGKTTSRSITIKKLKSAQEYKIKIRGYRTVKKKNYYGAYSSVLTTTTKPTQVKNLKATSQTDNSITLSWSKVSRATGYRVYIYNSSKKKYEYYGDAKTNSITIKKLKSAQDYKIKIRAYKTLNNKKYYGSYSAILTTATKPTVVKDMKVTIQTDTSINLEWSKVSRATGYRVYIYNSSKNSYDYYGESKTTSIKIEKLIPAKEYKIKVRAYKQVNNIKILSDSPKEIIETVTKPSKISDFKVLDSDSSSIKLSWNKISGVTGYKLYIYKSSTKEYEYYGKISSNNITISNLDSTLEYKFKVRAYKTYKDVQYFGSYSQEIEKRIRRGMDVSKWQGNIDWKAVKDSGIEFVMIRIGYRGYADKGTLCEDPYFKYNIENAINLGVEVGVYFFSYSKNEEEAEEEAKWVVDKLNEYEITGCKYIAYDFESWNKERVEGVSVEQINKNTKVFLKYVLNKGYTPILYGNKYDLTERFKTDEIVSEVKNCKVWLAQYNSKVTYDGKYHMWQYTSEGKNDGISGKVDLNKIYF